MSAGVCHTACHLPQILSPASLSILLYYISALYIIVQYRYHVELMLCIS